MIFYVTFNDPPSGIYSSQVIDTVKFFNDTLKKKTKLIAFISVRLFFANRKKIRQELEDAIVVPMFPGVGRWRMNAITLRFLKWFMQPHTIIGRSVLATHLALKARGKNTKIIYDGRGAIAAEWTEYGVISNKTMLSEITGLEREAVLLANNRIGISQKLVEYWQQAYGYVGTQHVVVPCTVNKIYESLSITEENTLSALNTAGFKKNDVVFVYSGSVAGWQSFDALYAFIAPLLRKSKKNKILFLSDKNASIERLRSAFEDQVTCLKVKPGEVPQYLLAADYGLMIREESVTNKVASPVKFSEYIACGLKVIISKNLGDYSQLVHLNPRLGSLSDYTNKEFDRVSVEEKNEIRNTAAHKYKKEQFLYEYQQLLGN